MTDDRLKPMDPAISPRFGDVATLLRAPRVPPGPEIDIALVGVPFDLGTNFRRLLAAVRRRCGRHPEPSAWSPHRDHAIRSLSGRRCRRCRDQCHGPQPPVSRRSRPSSNGDELGIAPITAGGDHTIPLPILRAFAKQQPVGLVQFDAHPDTLDTLMGTRINHATTFSRAVEEGLIDPQRASSRAAGSMFSADDASWSRAAGMRVIMDEFEALDVRG